MAYGLLQQFDPNKQNDWRHMAGGTAARVNPQPASPTGPPGTKTPMGAETVRGQMESLLDSNSAWIRRNEALAAEESNRRGLQNSSIAASAGRAAAIDAALPIASQDAAQGWQRNERLGEQGWRTQERIGEQRWRTGERVGEQGWQSGERDRDRRFQTNERIDTQNFDSRERRQTQDWESWNRRDTQNWQTHERREAQNWQMRRDTVLANLDRQTQVIVKNLDNANAVRLAQIQGQISRASQRDGNAAALYQNGLTNMTAVLNNPNMTPEQQRAGVATVIAQMRSGINFVQSL